MIEAFDKMVDWLEHRRRLAFKELKLGKLRKSHI